MNYEIERYGFLRVLRENYRFPRFYIPKVGWQHGWSFSPNPIPEEFNVTIPRDLNYPKVVQGPYIASIMRSLGAKKVLPFCLPYFLVPPQGLRRLKDSIIFIYPRFFCISDAIRRFNSRFIEFIAETSRDYNHIGILIAKEYEHEEFFGSLKTLGPKFEIYAGAASNDLDSLYRLRRIFELFEYMSSPVFGSHVYYGIETGVCVSVSSVFAEPSLNADAPWFKSNKNIAIYDHFSRIHSLAFISEHFPTLVCDRPRSGRKQYEWAAFCEGRLHNDDLGKLDDLRTFVGANIRGYLNIKLGSL